MSWGTRTGVTQSAFKDVLDVRLVRWTDDFATFEHPEGASQSFKAGQPVKLVNGLLIACVDDDTVCAGIAVKDASGVTNTPIPILEATEGKIFIVKCSATPALANVMTNFNVDLTAGLYTLNLASSAQPFFRIVALPTGFGTSGNENFQKAYVIIASAARQFN